MDVLIKLVIIGFALFPAAVLTAFLVSHYRKRMGPRLIVRTLALGVISGLLVLAAGPIIRWATGFAAPGVESALASAFIGAAGPEEFAKFLLLYFVVQEHKDCDSGGDLFCAAMLIGLGFAGLENSLYLLHSPDWLGLGTMRGVLSIPAHMVFGGVMGLFAARAYRGQTPALNWALALILPLLGHGFYDFPLMMWSELAHVPFANPGQIWREMFWFLMAVLIVSSAITFLICRHEMVAIFANDSQDPDVHLPARWAVRPWRAIGTVFVLSGAAVGLVGLWFVQSDEYRGAFLLAPSVFPHAFGWIMRLQPPEKAIGLPRVAER
ncbi:MAG TPA: PrsW family glutamic-type intramembrane protease [Dongiaceae bacterium]|jgi:RsiW-degrading membrane proteinase PrsW (M82 family)|nr:PrsW family glutamic-type intramembrane protease [Dongiaceae bacterium]